MGRKPKYEKAMTSAEKVREYRKRKKNQGEKEVNFLLSENALKKLDELVDTFGLKSRSAALANLIHIPLENAVVSMEGWKDGISKDLVSTLEGEQLELYIRLRDAAWAAICSQGAKTREELLNSAHNLAEKL
jgi:hypothetical protein